MSLKPLPMDANKTRIADRGSECYTKRWASVTTDGQAISVPVDCKEIQIHIEGSTVVSTVTGTITGSAAVNWTSDGHTRTYPICAEADETIITIAANAAPIAVSVTAWR